MPSNKDLLNKVILVTGAGDGMGKAAAIEYASQGASVILLGRDLKKLENTYDIIISNDSQPPMISLMDFSKADGGDYQDLSDNLISTYGHLDGLLLNAAILGDRSPISQYDVSTWVNTIHINLTSQFILTKTLLPSLEMSINASIVFTTSGVGSTGKAFWGAYSVSKFGVEGLCQILSNEYQNNPAIRFNCINPGAIQTKMRKMAYPLEDPKTLLKPEDILEKYIWLMSDESIGTEGQVIQCQ